VGAVQSPRSLWPKMQGVWAHSVHVSPWKRMSGQSPGQGTQRATSAPLGHRYRQPRHRGGVTSGWSAPVGELRAVTTPRPNAAAMRPCTRRRRDAPAVAVLSSASNRLPSMTILLQLATTRHPSPSAIPTQRRTPGSNRKSRSAVWRTAEPRMELELRIRRSRPRGHCDEEMAVNARNIPAERQHDGRCGHDGRGGRFQGRRKARLM
jgi:hypothetical protein